MRNPLLCTVIVMMIIAHTVGEVNLNTHSTMSGEEEALLSFKEGFKNPSIQFSSWDTRRDFCTWEGVDCTNTTGHVISLDLHSVNSLNKLQGQLNPSLLQLPYLSSLDLSGNDFMQSQVPAFLGSMHNLKHLNLSGANFKGNLPENLGNLSQLEALDLSGNGFSLKVNNLKWLQGLSSLKFLDLSGVDLSSSANDWLRVIDRLPSLVMLRLSGCALHHLPQSLPLVNLDSLITLDLSSNGFNSTIPDWLFENCHNLQHLTLSNNHLQGPIPVSIERLKSIIALDLSKNDLIGSIPSSLGQAHSFLKEVRLSNNHLNGSLKGSIGQLSKLVVLDLAQNNLEGVITDAHLDNFTSLRVLDLSLNGMTLNVSNNWVPPFQLETIGLANCQLGPQFPRWIQTQRNLSIIDLSNAAIFGTVPDWFWDLPPSIEYVDLSSNKLRGCGHDFSSKLKFQTLDLSNNSFSCPLPHFPPNMRTLSLARNSFYGTISHVCEMLGVNNSLTFLDLSSNNFSGNLPDCWMYGGKMVILNLGNNHFSGLIPESIGNLTSLHTLTMNGNYLSGEIPEALRNCKGLIVLDLASNQFSGTIPYWIGEEMQILKALILSGNSFKGNIPTSLCQLNSLQILDLSVNRLTGALLRCVFAAMATFDRERSYIYDPYTNYRDLITLTLKGRNYIYSSKVLQLLRLLDLSSNYLTEDIPMEITKHVGLHGLNLSRNQLVGSIPSNVGEMIRLESLDFSDNQLSCAIPPSMSHLSLLSHLNLSYNTFSGEIPSGAQLQSFDITSFEGNPGLCGLPLAKPCPRSKPFEDIRCRNNEGNTAHDGNHEENKAWPAISPFYISMFIGFFTGFWLFWGSLIFITSWRYAYFRFLGHMDDKIYVTVVVAVAKLRRKFQSQQVPR